MAEMNYQFTFDEDQEMQTQPIYLSSDDSEIASPHSSPAPQLPKNVPNTYSAITQSLQHKTNEYHHPEILPYYIHSRRRLR